MEGNIIMSHVFLSVLLMFYTPSQLRALPSDIVHEDLDRDLNPLDYNLPIHTPKQTVSEITSSETAATSADTTSTVVTANALPDAKAIQQIAQIFGIGSPKGHGKKQTRVEAPSFMINLYNSIANSTNGEARTETPFHANTIRCVTNERGRRKNRDVLHFKVDAIPTNERLLNAELYLFRLMPKLKKTTNYYQIGIYQITNTDVTKLIDLRQVQSHGTGWEVFNVTASIREWLADSSVNLGFYMNITSVFGEPVPNGAVRFSLRNGKRPNLVVFTKDLADNDGMTELRLEDGALPQFSEENINTHDSAPSPTRSIGTRRHHRREREIKSTDEKLCGVETMFVNFDLLGWSQQIVAPSGFLANKCSGDCPFPAKPNIPYSTHALVQSFMAMESPSVAKACCVPHELESFTFLYIEDSFNIVLKRVKNAVAVKCGCH